MNVLEITGEPIFHGGQERFIQNLIENIDETNLKIDVLTPYSVDSKNFCDIVEQHGGRVYSLDLVFQPGKSRHNLQEAVFCFLRSTPP